MKLVSVTLGNSFESKVAELRGESGMWITSLNPHFTPKESGTLYSCVSKILAGQRTERNFALAGHAYAIPTLEKDFGGNFW